MVNRNVYSIILFTLLFSSLLGNELSYIYQIFIFALLLISERGKFSFNRPTKIILKGIITILITLFLSTLMNLLFKKSYDVPIYNILKDIYHFSYPLFIILNGVLISKKLVPKKFIVVIIYGGIFSSILHLSYILQQGDILGFANDESELESALLMNGFTEVIAYFSLIQFGIIKKHKRLIMLLLLGSLILYFSRTIIITIFLVYFYNLRNKGIIKKIIISLIIAVPLISNLDETKFINKIIRTPQELFNTKFDSKGTINQNWRAYESLMAINGVLNSRTDLPIVIGHGLGSMIDLGFYQNLNGNQFRYVNKIHNGVAEFFFKSGFFGLFIYLLFNFQLIFSIPQNKKKFIQFFSISLFISGFVIGGILNKGELSNLLLAYSFFCASNNELYD